ncbi:MAG TPA: cupredoxin family copper-binding protein [Mucilaginibacter sp.]|nr:cupredoxin family copper-binding protein [Mucilaginibacter sp.]
MKKRVLYLALVVLSGIISIYSCSKSYNAPKSAGASASVSIKNMAFSPDTLRIKTGTTVTWMNNDGMTHTVTSNTALFDSGNLAAGLSFQYTFNAAGTFTYYCVIHAGMRGVVVVN